MTNWGSPPPRLLKKTIFRPTEPDRIPIHLLNPTKKLHVQTIPPQPIGNEESVMQNFFWIILVAILNRLDLVMHENPRDSVFMMVNCLFVVHLLMALKSGLHEEVMTKKVSQRASAMLNMSVAQNQVAKGREAEASDSKQTRNSRLGNTSKKTGKNSTGTCGLAVLEESEKPIDDRKGQPHEASVSKPDGKSRSGKTSRSVKSANHNLTSRSLPRSSDKPPGSSKPLGSVPAAAAPKPQSKHGRNSKDQKNSSSAAASSKKHDLAANSLGASSKPGKGKNPSSKKPSAQKSSSASNNVSSQEAAKKDKSKPVSGKSKHVSPPSTSEQSRNTKSGSQKPNQAVENTKQSDNSISSKNSSSNRPSIPVTGRYGSKTGFNRHPPGQNS